jgi:hypothetical protein
MVDRGCRFQVQRVEKGEQIRFLIYHPYALVLCLEYSLRYLGVVVIQSGTLGVEN